MSRVILHVGVHKTGTTSIQRCLRDSNEVLKKYGYYYPQSFPANHSESFFTMFSKNADKYHLNQKKGIVTDKAVENQRKIYFEQWNRELKKINEYTVIISGEDLSVLKRDEILEMKKFLEGYFDDYSIVFYMRDPYSWITSNIQQKIKNGINEFSMGEKFPNYYEKSRGFADVFGEDAIIHRLFDKRYLKNNDLIDDFFEAIGVEIVNDEVIKHSANTSLGGGAVGIMKIYNDYFPFRLTDGTLNEARYNPNMQDILRIFNVSEDAKYMPKLNFSESELRKLDREYSFIEEKFVDYERIERSDSEILLADGIDKRVLAEILNNYNELLVEYRMKNQKLNKEAMNLKNRILKKINVK